MLFALKGALPVFLVPPGSESSLPPETASIVPVDMPPYER